jgi:Tfp pilus assembly protein PilO
MDESWHLSKSVPVTLLVGLLVQGVGVVWMFSQMSSDVDNNTKRLDHVEVKVGEITDRAQQQAVQLGRIEAQIDSLMDKTDRILMAMERR